MDEWINKWMDAQKRGEKKTESQNEKKKMIEG